MITVVCFGCGMTWKADALDAMLTGEDHAEHCRGPVNLVVPDGQTRVVRHPHAAHAMQTGVALAMEHGSPETEPKHLRVEVNSAMSGHGSLIRLLIAKGVITESEYLKAIADGMEAEVASYRQMLDLPDNVSLQ